MTSHNHPERLFDVPTQASADLRAPPWVNTDVSAPQLLCEVLGMTGADENDTASGAQRSALWREAYAEGVLAGKASVEPIAQRHVHAIQALDELREQLVVSNQREIVDLALVITREVLRGEPAACDAFLEQMVAHALKILHEADVITLRARAEDCATLTTQHPELLSVRPGLKVVEDPTIELGGIIAECTFGRVDGTLDRQLAEAAKALRTELTQQADEP